MVAVLGVIDDVTRRTPSGFVAAGHRVGVPPRPDARSCPAGVGPRRAGHLVAAPTPGRPRRRAQPGPAAGRRRPLGHPQQRARPVRRRTGAGAGGMLFARGIRVTVRLEGDPFVGLFSGSPPTVRSCGRRRARRRPEGNGASLGVPAGFGEIGVHRRGGAGRGGSVRDPGRGLRRMEPNASRRCSPTRPEAAPTPCSAALAGPLAGCAGAGRTEDRRE
ncbi:MAG: hypothetical protein R2734_14125 [Nocardioides sp.]